MGVSIRSLPGERVIIDTHRLQLRAAELGDADDLHLCFSDPDVMRYWSFLLHKSMDETNAWVPKMVNSKETNGITDFVIVLRTILPELSSSPLRQNSLTAVNDRNFVGTDNGPVIGKIGIYAPLDSSKSGEIGFLLNKDYHRRGLVSEALSAMLEYLFNQRWVEAITTDVDPRNEASIGILQKHGFVRTGTAKRTWQIGEEWVDSEYRTLTKSAWNSRHIGES